VAGTVAAVLAFAVAAAWLAHSTWDHIEATRQDTGFQTDFRDAVYYPVVALTDGVNPYDPGRYYLTYPVGQEFPLYSPVHLVVHAPLAALDLDDARATYFGLNLVLMLVLAGASLRLAGFRVRADATFALGALLLLSGPGKLDLRNGEPTLIIVLACYLALAASRAHPARTATGVVVALAKPTFGVPLAIVLTCRRRVREVLIGVAIAVGISLLVAIPLFDDAGGVGPFVDSLRDDVRVTSDSLQSRIGSPLRIDGVNAVARATGLRPGSTVALLGGLGLLAVGAWAIARIGQLDPGSERSELAVTLAVLTVLVPLFRVGYDLLMLTWPVLLLLRRRPVDAIWPAHIRVVLVVLLLVPMVDPLSWSWVADALGRKGIADHLLGSTAMGLCLLAAFVICCVLALRPVRARRAVAT
jgi:Glycosyltransferase family 87